MNPVLEQALVTARFSLRLYLAPLVGATRGALHEVRRVRRQMEREQRRRRAQHLRETRTE
ncbi:MAG: hypothetical protein JWN34_5919 [Bryobacterales bacterium]|nr:hypothetical protein [Bryobacterales bacterium]